MAFFEDEYRPAFTFRGHYIYWTQVCVAIQVFFFFLGAILLNFDQGFVFFETMVTQRTFPELWRVISYSFFDAGYYQGMGQGCFWFLIVTFLVYFSGRNVERHVGGKTFLTMYFAAMIIPALVVATLAQFFPGLMMAGIFPVAFGVLVSEATIFPEGDMWGTTLSRAFFTWILIAVNAAIGFATHDYGDVIGFLVASVVGYFAMRFVGSGKGMDFIVDRIDRIQEARHERRTQMKVVKKQVVEATLDSVLEKISRQGVASLTPAERSVLQKASSDLRKRDSR